MTANAKPRTFDQLLALYVKSQRLTMSYARQLAELAIEHFAEHGNLTLAQRFHDAIEENYGRRVAFVKWMMAFSPCEYKASKFAKDKTPTAVEFNVDKAKEVAFWDFAPEKPIEVWEGATLIEALNRVLKQYEGQKKQPKDELAVQTLINAKRVIAGIHVPVASDVEKISAADLRDAKIEQQVKASLATPVNLAA